MKKISRRNFLLASGVVTVGAALAACGGGSSSSTAASSAAPASSAAAPSVPKVLANTDNASAMATICFFLDFFLIIVLLTLLETVFLAQLFRNLQHKIDARWAVLIILYYIRFPKISRG